MTFQISIGYLTNTNPKFRGLNENLVGIQLKSNATPIVYYFINNFDGVGEVLVEFRRVCDDLNITFQEMC